MYTKHNLPKMGFTLIELMTVVIIVSLLAALGVGYYKKSIEQSYFGEGLSTANLVAEAVNRAHADALAEGDSELLQPKMDSLDIALSNARSCATASNYCRRSKYFEISIGTTGITTATRVGGNYVIRVQPHFAEKQQRDKITCEGTDTGGNGVTFCQSMGFTSCSGAVCQRQ